MTNNTSNRKDCMGIHPGFGQGPEGLQIIPQCTYGGDGAFQLKNLHSISENECQNCPHYKSRYIQYPITVQALELDDLESYASTDRPIGSPVAVRPVNDEKTYLGFYLGDLPWQLIGRYSEDSCALDIRAIRNPAILVPALHRIVFGAESWWMMLKTTDDFKQITDDDIDSQWYVQLAKELQ